MHPVLFDMINRDEELSVPRQRKIQGRHYYLRDMQSFDIDKITALEQDIFPSPWSRNAFRNEVASILSLPMVIETSDSICAYAVVWFLDIEMHIANLGVQKNYRRLGLASWLLNYYLKLAQSLQMKVAHLEVRRKNAKAIRLYEKLGFNKVGIRKNYYSTEHEDAILMSYNFHS